MHVIAEILYCSYKDQQLCEFKGSYLII